MAPLNFASLSVEIKSLIVAHVTRPTDLKNLCLTSKQLHEIAVRPLYNEVTLDIGSPQDILLSSFLSPNNIGLKHIKKVDLYLATVLDPCNQLQQANFTIRLLIEFLPENILEKFSWHPWELFSGENLLLLYKKQRRMKWMEAIAMDRPMVAELEKLPQIDECFSEVRKLGLYPDSRAVLDYCQFLVSRTKNIEKITLHASFDDLASDPIPPRELNDSSGGPGLITSSIFSHMMPFDKCTPMSLRELTLQKVSLKFCQDTYTKIIEFSNVMSLRVFLCPGAECFFAELSKSSKLPVRLETLEFKHEDNNEHDGLSTLDNFLCLTSGLRSLALDIANVKDLPAPAGIVRHASTLKQLNVHAGKGDMDCQDDEIVYSIEHFEQICKACTAIEQLSVAFPATCAVRSNTENFSAFETAVGDIPSLITLNITTWPSSSTSSSTSSRLPQKIYEHLLQGMAQQGFEKSIKHAEENKRSSRLAVIAFGSSDKVYDREDSKHQMIFAKGKQPDLLGNERYTAIQVSWCLRKFVESRSDILDFSLSRSCRPPIREELPSDDSI
ncbi:hypothetical protein EJ05DRAFT_165717 [Pseudovirgaria hyperparasitica]|uniref:Uncharacterized protein n=1 Tax=Pseudovirgaria hyperparasitica TaxID=470096 RepID=A0A6A6VUZ4_9PEZI|nr:uncharacterized protein EJ05DRAFT_165717 [Pseudovirgaria hyperparasitica]KAF2753606.1 hypothetical protein EJ05DRAFT_165717 [Pseudovirgaria hyperparasitica]